MRQSRASAFSPERAGALLAFRPLRRRRLHPLPDPPDHGDGHGVAQRLVARGVASGLAAVFHIGPAVREPLQALAFERRQAAHEMWNGEHRGQGFLFEQVPAP